MPGISGPVNQQSVMNALTQMNGVENKNTALRISEENGRTNIGTGSAQGKFQGFSVTKSQVKTQTILEQINLTDFVDAACKGVNIADRCILSNLTANEGIQILTKVMDQYNAMAQDTGNRESPSFDQTLELPTRKSKQAPTLPPKTYKQSTAPAIPSKTYKQSAAPDIPPKTYKQSAEQPPQIPQETGAKSGGKSVQFDLAPAGKMAPMNNPKSALKSALKSAPSSASSGKATAAPPKKKAAKFSSAPSADKPPKKKTAKFSSAPPSSRAPAAPPKKKTAKFSSAPPSSRASASPPLPQRGAAPSSRAPASPPLPQRGAAPSSRASASPPLPQRGAAPSSRAPASPPLPQRGAAPSSRAPAQPPLHSSAPPPISRAPAPPPMPQIGSAQFSPPPFSDLGIGSKTEVTFGDTSEMSVDDMGDNIFAELGVITKQIISQQELLKVPDDVKKKFRYPNDGTVGKIPEATAVKLPAVEGEVSQRFQGNYVQLHPSEPVSIATQAPRAAAMGDFWLASLSHDTKAIVDLTQGADIGAGKAEVYYPIEVGESMPFKSGDRQLEVSLLSEVTHPSNPTITTSTYSVVDDQGNEKEVSRIHFVGWIDREGIDTKVLHQIIDTVDHTAGVDGGVMVHCSAGVGRTGTFLTARTAKHQLSGTKMDSTQIQQEILTMGTKGREQRNRAFIQKPTQMSTLINFFKDIGSSG
ncbi:MAG: hypothetical protein KAG53_07760 [Endozoicomonadaceae bacterium]|nr:hypothetical protein [Endozoicomonadaceae bacterium]